MYVKQLAVFQKRLQNGERRLLASSYLSVRLPVRPSVCPSVPKDERTDPQFHVLNRSFKKKMYFKTVE